MGLTRREANVVLVERWIGLYNKPSILKCFQLGMSKQTSLQFLFRKDLIKDVKY